jgi:hypothetical protein
VVGAPSHANARGDTKDLQAAPDLYPISIINVEARYFVSPDKKYYYLHYLETQIIASLLIFGK